MLKLIEYIETKVNIYFDFLETKWESQRTHSFIGYFLVFSFLLHLLLVQLQQNGLLPHFLSKIIPNNHFHSIHFAFTILLIFEVITLVFSIVKSVANSVGKQFEILSLILLRNSFKEFIYFPEPISWQHISEPIYHIVSDAGGALIIFIILGIYYKIQKHYAITDDILEQKRFISAKKLLAIILLIVFVILGVYDSSLWALEITHKNFFSTFYTVLIFSDILVVLISLKYCHNYFVVFRNSAFALTTVFIRLTLVAPPYYNLALAMFASIFALSVTLAYNYLNDGIIIQKD